MLIAPEHLWLDGGLRTGMVVEVVGGRVRVVRPLAPDAPDAAPFVLMPGPTDLQVNGGGGTMLNDDPTAEGVARIVAAHRARGTGEIMVTLITDHAEMMTRAADAVLEARGLPGLLGLHLEGPHIAPERHGAHDPARIRPLDRHTVAAVARLRAAGIPAILTLAPERADPALLAEAVATGAVVAAGHSAATAEETRAALAAGVTCFTHLQNAMPPMTSRAPGIVAAAILSDAFCGIVADGIHVHWDMIRLALAARPRAGRTFLVSDAMATVGGPDRFTLYGRTIRVADGALIDADGALAGAHLDMATALANVHRHAGAPLALAIAMATDVPRAAMGLDPVAIGPGTPLVRLLALDPDLVPMELTP